MKQSEIEVTERRKNTRRKVYEYLYRAGSSCTKRDIADALQLSMPTVYQDVDELLEKGLITYDGQRQSGGGRPSSLLRVVSNARTAVGIGINSGKLTFAAVNLSGKVIHNWEVRHHYGVDDPFFPVFLADELEIFLNEAMVDRKRLLGVGISIPGIVDPTTETIVFAPTLQLKNYSYSALKARLPYRVRVHNDANSGLFTEWYGSNPSRSIAYLSLEEGVGGAVLVNGYLLRGSSNRCGEFGHMCVEPNGLLCACGKRGCLEAYCSPLRISRELGVSMEEFFKGLDSGVRSYVAFWNDFKSHLAIGIHNMRMMMDGEVVLGGVLSEYLKPRMGELSAEVAKLDPFSQNTDYLTISQTTRNSYVIGAALMFTYDFLREI